MPIRMTLSAKGQCMAGFGLDIGWEATGGFQLYGFIEGDVEDAPIRSSPGEGDLNAGRVAPVNVGSAAAMPEQACT